MLSKSYTLVRGSALLISLAILTAITIAAVVAMQRSSVQIKMVRNLQHQHELNNAALSTLNSIFSQIEINGNLQNNIILEAESRYQDFLDSNQSTSTSHFDLISTFPEVQKPAFSTKTIAAIDVHARKLPSPEGSHYYLKAVEGCGTSCGVTYLAIRANSQAKNITAGAIQEIGVRRVIPGGAGQ